MDSKRRWPSFAAGAFCFIACLVACAGAIRTESLKARLPPRLQDEQHDDDARLAISPADAGNAGSAAYGDASPIEAEDDPGETRVGFAEDGTIGAWLVAGPFDRARLPDASRLSPRLGEAIGDPDPNGASPRWRLASAADGVLDLAAACAGSGRNGVAYAGATLHLERGGHHLLLLGVDDGVSVFVDGRSVFTEDRARPRLDDDDLIPLDLGAGDHSVVLAMRRRTEGRAEGWGVRARWLDPELSPPRGGFWRLAGTSIGDTRALVKGLPLVALDRGMGAEDYRPILTVHFRGGAPLGVAIPLRAYLVHAATPPDPTPPPVRALLEEDAAALRFGSNEVGDRIVALAPIPAADVEDEDWTVHVEVGGRAIDLPFHPRRAVREAAARAERAIAQARSSANDPIATGSLDTISFLRQRLAGFVARGDGDIEAQRVDARELDGLAEALERGRDPYAIRRVVEADGDGGADPAAAAPVRTGAMRRAYVSPVDGHFSEFAVYLPPYFNAARTYPLVVALHGMNGRPLEMIMWLFGHDDPDHDGLWEDRHPRRDLEPLDAIVIAPDGHFNAMYRDLGEDDVMRVIDWAVANYPVDPARVTITGPSMGGIGSAACALHYPDRFAAAEPLCGYHSYFVRGDIGGRALRPWERFLAEQRSNVFWAENGRYLPLYIVHGTKDLPEENSGVLIDRYKELHYEVEHEHPELGHNVWQTTYEDLKGARWLLSHRRPLHPRSVRFKTPGTRWASNSWVHVREMAASDAWGEVSARIEGRDTVWVASRGVTSLSLDRDAERMDDAGPIHVNVDGSALVFQAGEAIEMHLGTAAGSSGAPANGGRTWIAGPGVHPGLFKHGTVTGPLHDVFHEPILFVWGASDPAQARANQEVARAWARVRWGVRVDYPVMSDADFLAQGEDIANDKALFLVGNAASNRLVRELEPELPIRIDGRDVVVGPNRIAATESSADRSELGAAFIRPNPRRPDRYVVVVEGVGPLGTWRSLSLPDLLPDYVVFDHSVAPARGQLLLGAATLRAAGLFGQDWSLPSAAPPP